LKDTTPFRKFEYIRDAAALKLRLELWRTDQEFGGHEKGIFYAVDTDIVKLFSDPAGNIKYAAVFPGDDEHICEILAWALSRFIFFRLTKDRPPLVIPPHHQEMDRVFAGIARNATKERTVVSDIWPRLEKHLQEYKRTNDMDALVSSLKKEPLDLIRFAYGEGKGYTAELARITKLLKHDRLCNIERYVERRSGKPWTLPVPIPRDETVSRDYDTLKELSESWSKRLGATKSKSQKQRRFSITDDAEVLARLEWINHELEGTKKRVVLISGDPSLQRAAAEYYWDNSHTFADLFIRDPRVFLAAPDFLSAEPMNEEKVSKELKPGLIGWLDVFLARFEPGSSGYDKRLRAVLGLSKQEGDELAHKFREKTSDGISKLQRDWKQFIRLASVEYGIRFDQENFKRLAKIITKHGLSQVREQVDRQVSKVWHDVWNAAVETGFWSTDPLEEQPDGVMDKQQVLPLRGVPALRFTLKWADALSKDLCCTLDHEKIFQDSDSLARLKKEDPSNYTASVIYALAFGAKGRWGVAHILSEFALYIADHEARGYDLPDGYEPITGNEAAYLLAWAIRHNVKIVAQLCNARRCLKEAGRRKAKATGGDGADIRYESESIAIDMTYHLFRLFSQETIPADVPTLAQCQKRILKLLKSLELDKQEKEYIRLTVKKQLLVYLFCALLLRQFKDKETDMKQDRQEVLQWLPEFKAILECEGHRTKTCFTQPAYLCSCYLYGTKEQQEECVLAAKNILSKKRVRRCYVMPYDEALYAFFMDIITGHHT
jgi:hypothetical protein